MQFMSQNVFLQGGTQCPWPGTPALRIKLNLNAVALTVFRMQKLSCQTADGESSSISVETCWISAS